VSIVSGVDRHLFADPLAEMHRDRKRVFASLPGWGPPSLDDEFEIDQFDTDDATYVLIPESDASGHLGSVRLLPTTAPHLLSEVFPHLCEHGVPSDSDTWEITRFCLRPGLDDPRSVQRQLTLALVEYALLQGIRQYTCAISATTLPALLSVGWDCEPLGLPHQHDQDLLAALSISITPATLHAVSRVPVVRPSPLNWPAQTPLG